MLSCEALLGSAAFFEGGVGSFKVSGTLARLLGFSVALLLIVLV